MTIKEANAIDMVAYLSVKGFEPAKSNGINYWYYSPFRQESEPFFKVNRRRNKWHDFGEGAGANLLDFILRFENISITVALKCLEQHKHLSTAAVESLPADAAGVEILSVHTVSSSALIRYYQSLRISPDTADQYLQEIRYKNGEKTYYALGFKNDSGGYELRAPYFKGRSHPKSSTLIKNQAAALAVFEGFLTSFLIAPSTKINRLRCGIFSCSIPLLSLKCTCQLCRHISRCICIWTTIKRARSAPH